MSFKHNNSNWNEKKLKQLAANGKIKGYTVQKRNRQKRKLPKQERPSKEKTWLHWNIQYWCNKHAVGMVTEHRFHPDRGWRFDFAIPAMKIAVEYEGLMSEKSRHTTVKGYTGDTEKYNAATALGWKVIRYTALNYKNVLTDLSAHVH